MLILESAKHIMDVLTVGNNRNLLNKILLRFNLVEEIVTNDIEKH